MEISHQGLAGWWGPPKWLPTPGRCLPSTHLPAEPSPPEPGGRLLAGGREGGGCPGDAGSEADLAGLPVEVVAGPLPAHPEAGDQRGDQRPAEEEGDQGRWGGADAGKPEGIGGEIGQRAQPDRLIVNDRIARSGRCQPQRRLVRPTQIVDLHAAPPVPPGADAAQPALLPQSRIAEALAIDRTTILTLVAGLEARGLVSRVRDERDRRAYAVALTDRGERLRGEAFDLLTECEEQFLAPLPVQQQAALRRALATLVGLGPAGQAAEGGEPAG